MIVFHRDTCIMFAIKKDCSEKNINLYLFLYGFLSVVFNTNQNIVGAYII